MTSGSGLRSRPAPPHPIMVYFFECLETGRIKIGYSTNPNGRFSKIDSHSPTELQFSAWAYGGRKLEQQLHERFARFRIKNANGNFIEWFEPNPELEETVQYFYDERMKLAEQWVAAEEERDRAQKILERLEPYLDPADRRFDDRDDPFANDSEAP